MRFAQSDETFKHTDGLPILADSWVLPEELIVGVEDDFCFLTHDRLKDFLDESDVLAELIVCPELALTRLSLLLALPLQHMVSSIQIFELIV